MAAAIQHTTSASSAPVKRRLAELNKQSRDADTAALEDPELPACMVTCARRRIERMEVDKCRGPQMRLKPTIAG